MKIFRIIALASVVGTVGCEENKHRLESLEEQLRAQAVESDRKVSEVTSKLAEIQEQNTEIVRTLAKLTSSFTASMERKSESEVGKTRSQVPTSVPALTASNYEPAIVVPAKQDAIIARKPQIGNTVIPSDGREAAIPRGGSVVPVSVPASSMSVPVVIERTADDARRAVPASSIRVPTVMPLPGGAKASVSPAPPAPSPPIRAVPDPKELSKPTAVKEAVPPLREFKP